MSKKLIHVNPNLFLSSSTALIGSSAKLINSDLGKYIDSFENVVRFNRAVTKNFENSVGEKTTLRVVNNHVFDNVDISKMGYTNSPKNFVKKIKKQNILYIGPDEGPWQRRKKNSHKSNNLYKYEYSSIEKKQQYELQTQEIKYANWNNNDRVMYIVRNQTTLVWI